MWLSDRRFSTSLPLGLPLPLHLHRFALHRLVLLSLVLPTPAICNGTVNSQRNNLQRTQTLPTDSPSVAPRNGLCVGFALLGVPAMVVAATGFARVLAFYRTRPSDWASAELSRQSQGRNEASSHGAARLVASGARVVLPSLQDGEKCLRLRGPVSRARYSIAGDFQLLLGTRL